MVVLAIALEMYPELVELWTVSRNTAGHVQRPENEVTGRTKLLSLWSRQKELGRAPCYHTIVTSITRGRPWWANLVEHFSGFLERHAGGVHRVRIGISLKPSTPTVFRATSGKCLDICGKVSR